MTWWSTRSVRMKKILLNKITKLLTTRYVNMSRAGESNKLLYIKTIELNIIEQHLPTFTKPSKWSSLSTWSTFLCRVCFSFRDYISLKLKTTFRHFKFSQWQQPKTCFHCVCTPLIFVNDLEWSTALLHSMYSMSSIY